MTGKLEIKDVYPNEFGVFFKAMVDEMKRHEGEKGDSWKKGIPYWRYSSMPPVYVQKHQDTYLRDLLDKAIEDYRINPKLHQLVDIANICGMLWSRGEILRSILEWVKKWGEYSTAETAEHTPYMKTTSAQEHT